LHVSGAVGMCDATIAKKLRIILLVIVCEKMYSACITRLINLTMHFKSIFLQETAFLNFIFSAMPVADGFFGWRMAMACIFFGGLTNMSRLATA